MNQCWRGQKYKWQGGCLCSISLRKKKTSAELRDRIGIEAIGVVQDEWLWRCVCMSLYVWSSACLLVG